MRSHREETAAACLDSFTAAGTLEVRHGRYPTWRPGSTAAPPEAGAGALRRGACPIRAGGVPPGAPWPSRRRMAGRRVTAGPPIPIELLWLRSATAAYV